MKEPFTIAEVCEKLGWSKTTVRLWASRMGLGHYVIGEDKRLHKMFTRADLVKLLDKVDGRTTRWSKAREAGNG